jgi:LysM repeat protein
MGMKLAAGGAAVFLLALLLQGCLFGGGGNQPASISRPSSIPSATPPPNLPEPVLLGPASAARGTSATPGAGNTAETYTVKQGETLNDIAAQLGISDQQAWIAEVLRLNGLADARLLAVGQVLQLPRAAGAPRTTTGTPTPGTRTATPAGTSTPGSASTPTPTPRATAPGGGGTYTVESGDNPTAIAEKLGVPESQRAAWVEQFLALNNVSASGLVIGDVLKLPPGTPGASGATATPVR